MARRILVVTAVVGTSTVIGLASGRVVGAVSVSHEPGIRTSEGLAVGDDEDAVGRT